MYFYIHTNINSTHILLYKHKPLFCNRLITIILFYSTIYLFSFTFFITFLKAFNLCIPRGQRRQTGRDRGGTSAADQAKKSHRPKCIRSSYLNHHSTLVLSLFPSPASSL